MGMHIITAAFAQSLPEGLVGEIVYLPEGEHRITPLVDGKAKEVTVKISPERGEEIAAIFQQDLEERGKGNVRPWFDFEHKAGVASALPKAFRYERGAGVMVELEWTGAGRAALEGRDFSYFSPTFQLGEDGVPVGLPDRGPLGGLVNEPAFREIPRIAAKDAANIKPMPSTTMSKLILAALAIQEEQDNAEQAAVAAINQLKSDHATVMAGLATVTTERDGLKREVENLRAEAADARMERAKGLVEAAISDGRLAPKDAATNNAFIQAIAAELASGVTMQRTILASLPRRHNGLDRALVTGGDRRPDAAQDLSPYERMEAAFAAESDG